MNIIITGASSGIGYQTAKKFALLNHSVIAISRNKEKLAALKNEITLLQPKAKIYTLSADITKFTSTDLKRITKIFQEVDILINNAGRIKVAPFEEFNLNEAQKIFDVNFFGAAVVIKYLLPHLLKATTSHVLNISSMGGFQGASKFAGLSFYSASKAALANLTECLAEEYKNTNIVFNCLCLGAVETEMLKEAFPNYQAPTTAEDMANYLVNFALNGSSFFKGKVLPVSISTP